MMNLETLEGLPISECRSSFEESTNPIPLSRNQKWIFQNGKPSNTTSQHLWTCLKILGSLNIEVLQRAYADVINKHEILTSKFHVNESNVFQQVFQEEEWHFDVLDFCKASDSEIRHFMLREAKRSFILHRQAAIRSILIKGDIDHHFFSVVFHPLAADTASVQVFCEDLIACYQMIENDESYETHEGLQYDEVAFQQIEPMGASGTGKKIGFWRDRITDFEKTPIPVDYHVHDDLRAGYSMLTFQIPDEQSTLIDDQLDQCDIDGESYFFAAFIVLLHQYCRKNKLVVGFPFNGRNNDHDSVIGPFETVTPIMSSLNVEESFLKFIREVQKTSLKALDFKHLTEQEATLGNPNFDLSDLQCKFNYRKQVEPSYVSFAHLKFEWEISPLDCSPFQISFTVNKRPESFEVSVNFRVDLFSRYTISDLEGRFNELLAFTTKCPEEPISTFMFEEERNS